MNISSFDIFDTCLIRKCGTPENIFDVFSLQAFTKDVSDLVRQEFVATRVLTQQSIQSHSTTLQDIWDAFCWTHPQLKSKEELYRLELETERKMLVPVLQMRDKVSECRQRGDKIIFISDMYLSTEFLVNVMRECGFYQDGDSLYVSCECQAVKWDGELFRYVREKEGLRSFRHWHHYGDNKVSDYRAPRKLGIRCTLINHKYTPCQKRWIESDYATGIKVNSIMAGISHAICLSNTNNTHLSFVTDIVAPLYASFVYRVMRDASNRGITKLFFCARDAYTVYLIALRYKTLFPAMEVKYLYISQKSLYQGDKKAAMQYFKQEGLASKLNKVAIVDIRSSGKTVTVLNDMLEQNGYPRIMGYYFELIKSLNFNYDITEIYSEWQAVYVKLNPRCCRISNFWQLYEMFFSIHNQNRTIDYEIKNTGEACPVFDFDNQTDLEEKKVGNAYVLNSKKWELIHQDIILTYIEIFLETSMYKYADIIFEYVAMPTFIRFMEYPDREYALALEDILVYSNKCDTFIPYAKRENWIQLLFKQGKDTYWKRATKMMSLPQWFVDLYIRITSI